MLSAPRRWRRALIWMLVVLPPSLMPARHTAAELTAEQILLVVNKNSADSQKLAELYAQLRHVPPDQTVMLDLPDAEEMPFNTYETQVVGPLRQFMVDHQLQGKIKCLLTFYGVPFRIADRINSHEDLMELEHLRSMDKTCIDRATAVVQALEKQASELNPKFKPGSATTPRALAMRAQAAVADMGPRIEAMTDPTARTTATAALMDRLQQLGGAAEMDGRFGAHQRDNPNVSPEERQKWIDMHEQIQQIRQQIEKFQGARWDPDARFKTRTLWAQAFGLLGEEQALTRQIEYFDTDHTAAATDNELALLWWDYYPRSHWMPNPLYYRSRASNAPVLMVMRLDGPSPAIVEKMMRTSVQVEETGLTGIAALDARGIDPVDEKGKPSAFGMFDEHIRNLALLLRTKTRLRIKLGDQEPVFPAHTVKGVALYCGWYSVGNYIPGCDFNPGAVGYHIASYEMVSLHTPSTYWVRGLLSDGVVATLGPVAEPYLGAFPLPDEFFPLLLTGKLTLAEVYWRTTPMTSWMISFIGDPLYTPYRANPPMEVGDIPAPMRLIFAAPTSQPASRPVD
jgi:uncharacterized protein (TIGR03790 family)